MNGRNWFELLMPTILVGFAWLGLSAATTLYISWLDEWHQQVMSENVASIQAAAEMQHALWELQVAVVSTANSGSNSPAANVQPPNAEANFRSALAEAELAAYTEEEAQLVGQIRREFTQYLLALEHSRSSPMPHDQAAAMAMRIAGLCDQLRTLNERLIERRSIDHRRWGDQVRTTRLLVAVLGPLVGVWLGYRAASRLRQRLAAIHVTLDGAAEGAGRVFVEPIKPDGNLDAIDRQVREVAVRLHKALSEAEGARQEAIRNERLAAVGQLAAGVAHELRNPLTAVKLLVQKVAQRSASEGLRDEPLAVVQDEIARMEHTIQSLLDYARPSAAQRVRGDLREILLRAFNLVQGRAAQASIHIDVTGLDIPVLVLCDPEQLHQVFVNLLLNGMDAMPRGGTLSIELRSCAADTSAPECVVTVTDQGPGIPLPLLQRIFEPFVTTKSRGTGLGLATSRRLVEEHGGQLTAANCPTGGAVFSVRLPCLGVSESGTDTPLGCVASLTEH